MTLGTPFLFWSLIALAVLAFVIAIWAFIGDRPRDRRRCPKCWYDLRATPDSFTCTECGFTAKKEKHLHRTRRRRKTLLASLLISLAAAIPPLYRPFLPHFIPYLPNTALILAIRIDPNVDIQAFAELGNRILDGDNHLLYRTNRSALGRWQWRLLTTVPPNSNAARGVDLALARFYVDHWPSDPLVVSPEEILNIPAMANSNTLRMLYDRLGICYGLVPFPSGKDLPSVTRYDIGDTHAMPVSLFVAGNVGRPQILAIRGFENEWRFAGWFDLRFSENQLDVDLSLGNEGICVLRTNFGGNRQPILQDSEAWLVVNDQGLDWIHSRSTGADGFRVGGISWVRYDYAQTSLGRGVDADGPFIDARYVVRFSIDPRPVFGGSWPTGDEHSHQAVQQLFDRNGLARFRLDADAGRYALSRPESDRIAGLVATSEFFYDEWFLAEYFDNLLSIATGPDEQSANLVQKAVLLLQNSESRTRLIDAIHRAKQSQDQPSN